MNHNLLSPKHSRLYFIIFIGFFCLSLVYFISRGPWRAVSLNRCDFTVIYLGSSLWLKGLSPYNHDEINRLWKINEPSDDVKITDTRPAVYPIPVFPLVAPLTFLKLSDAKFVWTGINCLAFFGAILALISFSKLKVFEWDAILVCCLALSLNPIHAGIQEGNPSVLAGSLMVISLWAADRGQLVLAAILFALTLCLKVNITIIFFLYFILTKKYKLLIVSLSLISLILLIALLPTGLNLEWWYSWRSNVNAAFSGGINDPNLTKPIGYFNLDYTAIKIIDNMMIIKVIDLLLLIGYISVILKYYKIIQNKTQEVMLLSFIVIINLLLMPYQRNYNGTLLILPIALSFILNKNKLNIYGTTILILLVPFLFPLSATVAYLLQKNSYYWLLNSPWFNFLFFGHRTWILLVISVIMIRIMYLDYLKSQV
jgi:Glycosyltransferase family 87